MKRTQDEIVARIEAVKDDDWLRFRREVLIPALDFEHAKPYLRDGVTADQWHDGVRHEQIEAEAKDYYEFAAGKIRDHRGISAKRSVEKLAEYAWLLGRDDVVEAMDAAEYPQYGAPKVKAFGDGFGLVWADGDPELQRMGEGLPCVDECMSGCGW